MRWDCHPALSPGLTSLPVAAPLPRLVPASVALYFLLVLARPSYLVVRDRQRRVLVSQDVTAPDVTNAICPFPPVAILRSFSEDRLLIIRDHFVDFVPRAADYKDLREAEGAARKRSLGPAGGRGCHPHAAVRGRDRGRCCRRDSRNMFRDRRSIDAVDHMRAPRIASPLGVHRTSASPAVQRGVTENGSSYPGRIDDELGAAICR